MSGRPGRALELCGATPVYISSNEVFTAMQLGTIQGAMSGWSTYYKRGWYEVGKYIIDIPYSFTVFMTAANLGAWRKVPTEIQKLMIDTGREVAEWMLEEAKKDDKVFRQKLIEAGRTPAPEYSAKCESCSLMSLCLPKKLGKQRSVKRYLSKALECL